MGVYNRNSRQEKFCIAVLNITNMTVEPVVRYVNGGELFTNRGPDVANHEKVYLIEANKLPSELSYTGPPRVYVEEDDFILLNNLQRLSIPLHTAIAVREATGLPSLHVVHAFRTREEAPSLEDRREVIEMEREYGADTFAQYLRGR